MSVMVARCRSCGFEEPDEFARCRVCHGSSGWWCADCRDWRPTRACPACVGGLVVPAQLNFGELTPGARVTFSFRVHNSGKKPLDFTVRSVHPALALSVSRKTVKPGGSVEIGGTLTVPSVLPGSHTFLLRYDAAVPAETRIVVEVVPALVKLEFGSEEVELRGAIPGKLARQNVTLRNAGNVPIVAGVTGTEPWLKVRPALVELAPGSSATLKLTAKSRRSDHGVRAARLRAVSGEGWSWYAAVRLHLPEPELDAAAVDLGEVRADRPAFGSLILRNVGEVRVACTVAAEQSWLAVTPRGVNLPPGKEKVLKLRAVIPENLAGPREGVVVVALDGAELLRVPVTVVCKLPRAVLGAIRRQTLAAVASDMPVVRRFRVANTGDGRLACTVSADAPWVEVLTPEFHVGPGKKRRVEFRLDAPRMPLGKNTATIRVRGNGGDADVPLTVTVVEPDPRLEVLGDVTLGTVAPHGSVAASLAVRNTGVGLLHLRAEPEDPRVTVTPADAALAPGPPLALKVLVAVAGLEGGEHAFGVRFAGGGSGRAEVRFRLPVEQVDVPSLIDLGKRGAGRPVTEALSVRNIGPDAVALRLVPSDARIRLSVGEIVVKVGETVAVPFRVELPAGGEWPIVSQIRIEGRTLRYSVALRVEVMKVDLVTIPATLALGDLVPGREREVAVRVENRGEVPAEVRASHSQGDLEVWVGKQTVAPGATATLPIRVKLHSRALGKEVRAAVHLADEAVVRLTATVARPLAPRVVVLVAVVGGVLGGVGLGLSVGWVFGVTVAVAGLVACRVLLATGDMQ
jgi:hypothetical protein